jgi:DNA polymerase-3 subunit gamma/tau
VSYQVLARKWRPKTFSEVVGQQGVTQTLRNAIASGRIGQSFIFAGARGVGKTTTARILAKALNCVTGPTVEPCGTCDACTEIAEGRDLDVLEIDAATHTQVEKVRDIIIDGLSLRPVRDRYKIFIIDEVHMLSNSSFNALLKSVEEPPPHVVFMMATTELHKIPDTIRSRSQEFEFRTIATTAIAAQLTTIAEAEGIEVEPAALQLIARSAEGSLRDAESAFDQVIAFAGERIGVDDVTTVLGLVGRDFLLDIVETVAAEDAARVFDVAGRAVEAGHDLRLLCRELARVVRDMMVVSIDPDRVSLPEFAPEGDVDRLQAAAARFSREDLLRGFDILSKAEFEVRNSPQPRYHFEMGLLKWIYARRMVPLAALIEGLEKGTTAVRDGGRGTPSRPTASPAPAARAAASPGPTSVRRVEAELAARRAAAPAPPAPAPAPPAQVGPPPTAAAPPSPPPAETAGGGSASDIRDAIVEEIRKQNRLLHGTAVAQARRIELQGDVLTFTFGPNQRLLKDQLEQKRAFVESTAAQVAGRKLQLAIREEAAAAAAPPETATDDPRGQLKRKALESPAVQAVLDVFKAEIRDVEEIENGS